MAVAWCKPCKDRGMLCIAVREVAGTPMCHECIAGKPSNGVRTELAAEVLKKKVEEKQMAHGKHLGIDWEKVQDERNGGASAADLAEKHGCHVSLIYARTQPAGGPRKSPKSAAAAKRGRPAKSAFGKGGIELATLVVAADVLDLVWATLPLDKKAALLNRLHEVN